jgi:aminoglycoside phosphotransferase (APT) family kinase protein
MSGQRANKDEIAKLRATLEEVLSNHFGSPRQIKKLRRRRSAYSSSYTIQNLEVELDRGQVLRLVLKDMSRDSLSSTAHAVRPEFLYQARREIETYQRLLHPQRFGTAICYGASANQDQHCWLFLERVDGPLLWQTDKMELWQEAARWLARLHAQFDTRNCPRPATEIAHLLRYGGLFFTVWLRRAEEFLRCRDKTLSRETWRAFGRLAERYDTVVARLSELPTTLIHGEFYPSNVIVRRSKQASEICPIDWEVAAIGPGLIDLAALTSGDWTESNRTAITAAYREELKCWSDRQVSMPELTEAVEYCQLHICVQLLGWACDWSPPEQHAQNWLQEALRLANRLRL